MGIAFPDATFFRGTIKENILLGNTSVTDGELISALCISGADLWLKNLARGLDTPLGENGLGLSNGQRQTLALARAFLTEKSCYVLDEPTSNLDPKSEIEFVERITELPPEKTIIIVSHRPQLLEAVDRLIVLEKGRVVLDGEKTEVMRKLHQLVDDRKRKRA